MAKKRPLRLEDIFTINTVARIAISPDGARIVFELKRHDKTENKNFMQLMIADVASGDVRPLTDAAKHSDTLPKYSPKGDLLGFISTRERKTPALFVLPMTGGEPRRITDLDGDVSDFSFSPNGRKIAYVYQPLTERQKLERQDKDDEVRKGATYKHITRLTHKLDGSGFWNGQYKHVCLINTKGGKPKQLTRGDYDDAEPRFSPDGKQVSFVSNRTDDPDRNFDQADIYVTKLTGGGIRRITKGQGACGGHSWSPDGKTMAFLGMPNKPGEWWKYDEHVHLVDAKGGKPVELVRDIDNVHFNDTIGDLAIAAFELAPPIWSHDGSRLYFLVSEEGATHLYSRSIHRKDTRREIDGKLNVMYAAQATGSDQFALAIGTATNCGDIFAWKPGDKEPRQLSDVNRDALRRVEVVEPEEFRLKSGEVDLQCWVIKPPGFRADRKHPAILEIHGGPMAQYGYAMFFEMQLMAARGYVVAYCNPRGSTGRGRDFRKCITGDWGNLDHKDVKKLGDWLFGRKYVDSKRVGLTGGSYGGYMTNWIIGHEQRYRAAVTQRSVVNWHSMFGTSDFGHVISQEIGGTPWKAGGEMWRQSPFAYVEKMHTPLLIIHSEQDLRCPLEQAEQLFVALKYLGREVEYVAFEGESHGLSRGGRPQNRIERLKRIIGWFDKHMTP
jgi:dipeptidyl aminopeptidase/acylaminoacyl peptidase